MKLSQSLNLALAATALSFAANASAVRVEGFYTVPAGEGLDEPLDVSMPRARIDLRNGVMKLDYAIPKELDGATPQRFRLKGQVEDGVFSLHDTRGDDVTAACHVEDDAYVCNMSYTRPFSVDVEGALAYMQTQDLAPQQMAQMQRGSVSLQHQAAGIVTIPRD